MPSGSGLGSSQIPVHEQLVQDIEDFKDFLAGAGKSVSTATLGAPGDIESIMQDIGGYIVGSPAGEDKIQLLPQTADIESALGVYSAEPSRAETAGSVAGSVLDPASYMHGMMIGLGAVRNLRSAGHAVDGAESIVTGVQHAKTLEGAAAATRPMAELSDAAATHTMPEGVRDSKIPGLNSYPLNEVLNHPALYDAYPRLADTKVQYYKDSTSDAHGSYNPETKRIKVNLARVSSDEDITDLLLHEVQHSVQDIERLPKGSNIQKELRSLGEDPDLLTTVREQQTRLNDKYKELVSAGIDPHLDKNADNLQVQLYKSAAKSYRGMRDKIATAYGNYLAAPGETQARNTQARSAMSIRERNALPASQTENKTASQIHDHLEDLYNQGLIK